MAEKALPDSGVQVLQVSFARVQLVIVLSKGRRYHVDALVDSVRRVSNTELRVVLVGCMVNVLLQRSDAGSRNTA